MEVSKEEKVKYKERGKDTVKLGIVTETDEAGKIWGFWITNCKVKMKPQTIILDQNSKVWERKRITSVRAHYFNDTDSWFSKWNYCHFIS